MVNDSILLDNLDADTSSNYVRVLDLAHDTISGGDSSGPTSSIAGTHHDDPDSRIITPTDFDKVSSMVGLICHCLTYHATY